MATPSPNDVIGVGLIGCGNVARLHTSALRDVASNGVPIRGVAAADPSEENRRIVERNFPFERHHDDWHRVLDDPEVDAVYVCTPTAMHRELYTAVLDAGKHLYAEKPIAPTLADVRAVAGAAVAAPGVAQVGFQSRFHAVLSRARDLVRSGELGPVMTYSWRDDETFPTTTVDGVASDWRSQRATAGGGVLLEHSIHGIDVLSWTFDDPVAVSARTRSTLGFDVEDTAAMRIDHRGGVSGTLVTVYGGVVGRTESRFEIFCERGVIEVTWSGAVLVDDPALTMRVQRSGESAEDLDVAAVLDDRLAELGLGWRPFFWQEAAAAAVFAAITEDRPASPGFGDAVRAHAVVDAAYRSSEIGDVVAVEAKPVSVP